MPCFSQNPSNLLNRGRYLSYNSERDQIHRLKMKLAAQPKLKTLINRQALNNNRFRLRWNTFLVIKPLTAMLNRKVLLPYKTIAIFLTAFQNIKFSARQESQIALHKT